MIRAGDTVTVSVAVSIAVSVPCTTARPRVDDPGCTQSILRAAGNLRHGAGPNYFVEENMDLAWMNS
jgi:hypothetical protein